jgi:alkanesulfonate monooxygenase SsuD/methylene tetrahydromethanopterin reductase-like flavin-dependent oxidoreductase (luciferase family)
MSVNVFMFHLMPYGHLPASYEGPAWVTCPNRLYDPARGHELYNRYIDELVHAETLGFDGVCVNEHHANAYGNMRRRI